MREGGEEEMEKCEELLVKGSERGLMGEGREIWDEV